MGSQLATSRIGLPPRLKMLPILSMFSCLLTASEEKFEKFPSWLTFRRIVKKRSTEEFSGVPYNMTMLNCLLSAWYGMPFVTSNNILVWTINGTGSVLEAIYALIFLIFAPKKVRVKMLGLLILVTSMFAAVVLISLLALHGENRKIFCGSVAAVFSICMYASPLAVMRLVIRTKSVEFMPFLLSLFSFLCATSWFIYGILGRDPFILVPNGCGCCLGLMQLILYAIYRKNKGQGNSSVTNGNSVQIGDMGNQQNNEQV